MFFSPELLSKRDSGFGLLWLAATLGSKSSFKKLPRRSIQTADIPQLCDLIRHPSEPLALRLSSNLMVGVARVYKSRSFILSKTLKKIIDDYPAVKHEIFVTDVSNCFVHLRKAVQEMHALGALSEAQLQMGQPSVRPDALTLTADPSIAVAFEFDAFANWADLSGFGMQRQRGGEDDDDDDEFTPGGTKSKAKSKGKAKTSLLPSETGRGNLHTLDEHHEHLLSTSFDANGSFLIGIDPSSSQIDPGLRFGSFGFDDNIFGPGDNFDMDLGDIGDELARELGEGWGADIPQAALDAPMDLDQQPDFNMMDGFDMGIDQDYDHAQEAVPGSAKGSNGSARKRPFSESDKENFPPGPNDRLGMTPRSITTQHSQVSAPRSFIEELIANDNQIDVPELVDGQNNGAQRKPKRVRILLDARTELTDEELKSARDHYVERQRVLRLEMEKKRVEKEGGKALEDLIWGVPDGLTAPALTIFWSEIYKVQVEARTGNTQLENHDEPPAKRRKKMASAVEGEHDGPQAPFDFEDNNYAGMEYDFGFMDGDYNAPVNFGDGTRIRSSELLKEPEQGRDAGPHASSHLGFDAEAFNPSSGTQRSAFFPWDNAAGTSSSAGAGFAPMGEKGSDRISLDNADVRIRRSRSRSGSRRGSFSIVPSQNDSLIGLNLGMSPSGTRGSAIGDDFQFDVSNEGITGQDTQVTENIVTLERTSYNFLEYCKMQAQGLSGNRTTLDFNDVVPAQTSSRRVAAAAFHHCLVLATKDLIIINQGGAYGELTIRIK
ncbi:REC8 [Sanghuangporus weigelae]